MSTHWRPQNHHAAPPKARRRAPPLPAMFRLFAPVAAAVIEEPVSNGGGGRKEADVVDWPQPPPPPGVTSTGAPIAKPNAKIAAEEGDKPPADSKPLARDEGKQNGTKDEEDGEDDSITGEINEKSPPGDDENPSHHGSTHKPPTEPPLIESGAPEEPSHRGPKDALASSAEKKNDGPDDPSEHAGRSPDDDDEDDNGYGGYWLLWHAAVVRRGSPVHPRVILPPDHDSRHLYPKTALKCPRNSASAIAYAERVAAKEEAGGLVEGDEREGLVGAARSAAARTAAFTAHKMRGKGKEGAKKKADGGERRDGEKEEPAAEEAEKAAKNEKGKGSDEGRVERKRTLEVPGDLPPRERSARAKKILASLAAAGGSKSPPSEPALRRQSFRAGTPTEKAAAAAAVAASSLNTPAAKPQTENKNAEPPEEELAPNQPRKRLPIEKKDSDAPGQEPAKKTDVEPAVEEPERKRSSPRKKAPSAETAQVSAEEGPSKESSPSESTRPANSATTPESPSAAATIRPRKNAAVVADASTSNPTAAKTARQSRRNRDPSNREAESDDKGGETDQGGVATAGPRRKRSREPSLAAEEARRNEAAARAAEKEGGAAGRSGQKSRSSIEESVDASTHPSDHEAEADDKGGETDQGGGATAGPRRKRSRKPSLAAEEARKNEAAARAAEKEGRAAGRSGQKSRHVEKVVSSTEESVDASTYPSDHEAEADDKGGETDQGGGATAGPRRKRSRKPSLAAEEARKNEAAARAAEKEGRAAAAAGRSRSRSRRKARAVAEELVSNLEESVDVATYPVVRTGLDDYQDYAEALGFDEAYLVHNDESGFVFSNDAGDRVIVIGKDEHSYIVQVLFDSYDKREKGRLYEVPIADFYQNYPYRGAKARRPAKKTPVVAEEVVSDLDVAATARRSKRKRDPSEDEEAEDPNANEEEEEEASILAEEEEEEGTTRRRRRRKPSLAAEEAKKNEDAALRLADDASIDADTKMAVSSEVRSAASPRRKRPAKKKAPAGEASPSRAMKDDIWNERISMLKAHKELYGTCNLNHAPRESVDILLRSFVAESRKQGKKFQRGEHSSLTAARFSKLQELGFDFFPMDSGGNKESHDRRHQKQWDEMFEQLEKYKAEHGDCLVSCVNRKRGKLGNWVRGQRKHMTKVGHEGFDPRRLAKLEALGFDFNPMASGSHIAKKRAAMFPKVDANWEKHFQNLVLFKKKYGNVIVGPSDKGWPGLYDWIHCQRKEYKRWEAGDERALMYDRWITKLNEVGFDWAPMKGDGFSRMLYQRQNKLFNDKWMKHYGDLVKFKHKNGHCNVRRTGSTAVLGEWLHHQRKYKRNHDLGKRTALTEERLRLLDEIGLDWRPSVSGSTNYSLSERDDKTSYQEENNNKWMRHYGDLVKFKKKNGHCNVRRTGSTAVIGEWLHHQRQYKRNHDLGKKTSLTEERIRLLDEIGLDWRPSVSGRTNNSSAERVDEIALDWRPSVSGRTNNSSAERDEEWESTFEELRAFKEEHGHADPNETDPKLGPWATEMRELYQQNERTVLTDRKIAQLESLGFKFVKEHAC